MTDPVLSFLLHLHPYDALPENVVADVATEAEQRDVAEGDKIYSLNDRLPGLFIVMNGQVSVCLLYTSPSPRDQRGSRMPSSA